jgi:ABC-type branched-subunit amino acid transport system ATPase component/MFS family permease
LAKTQRSPAASREAFDLAEEDAGVTEAPDQWVGEAVQPRSLVPSNREEQFGARRAEYTFEQPDQEARQQSFGERARAWAKDADPRQIKGPKFPLLVLGLLFTLSTWDDTAIGIIGPEMTTEFGVSLAFLVTLSNVLDSLKFLLAPAVGFIADRVKGVYMVRLGAILANLSSIWLGVAPGVGHVIGSRFTTSLGNAVNEPAAFPLVADYYPPKNRARVIGFLSLAGGVGGIIGPPLAGNLASAFGWRAAVVGLAALASAAALLTFLLKEPIRGYWDRLEMGASQAEATKEQNKLSWGEAWRASFSIVSLRRICFATPFLFVGGTITLRLLGFYYAQVFQLGPAARGYIGALNATAGLVGIIVGVPIADRMLSYRPGRVLTMQSGLVTVQAISFVILGVSPNLALSVVAGVPAAFAGGLLYPALITLISLVVPARIRGQGIQTQAPFQLIGIILVNIIFYQTQARWGLRGSLLAFAPLLVIGAAIYASAALGVARDIRAAQAASLAEQEMQKAREAGRTKLLVCRDVDVTYEGTQVLFNVDFDVEEGEVVALLGTNGAGKSSLLRAIAGLHEASNGAIFLEGRDITHVPPHENAANGVVMLPGGRAVFPTLTVEENLRAAVWMNREDENYLKEGVERVLNFFPVLRDRLSEMAGNLSGGEQQMLALGQVFLMKPRLLMIDELSLGLAPGIVQSLLESIRAINSQGVTIIIVEQSINVALTIAERAVFMEKGEIRFDGSTRELLSKPDLVRAVFLGIEAGGGTRTSGRRRRIDPLQTDQQVLTVEGVSVAFGGVKALEDVGLELGSGEIVGLIGPNGAGKTTLFDVISGFVTPDTGRVLLEGKYLQGLGPDGRARLGLGRSFQNASLFPAMTVRENIAVALERHLQTRSTALAAVWAPQVRRSERRAARRAEELIRLMNLRAYADKFVDELSTGTRRAVDIACVLASEPRVLLLDEPSSGLAQAETEELGPVLTRLVRDTGCSILVIEHDIPLISSISDRLIAMELGRVIATGAPQDVLNDPQVLASYLSASADVVARSGELTTEALIEDVVSNRQSTNGKPNPPKP